MPNNIFIKIINTPLGEMIAGATVDGLCLLEFIDRPALAKEKLDLIRLLNANFIEKSTAIIDDTERQVQEYFMGARRQFEIKINAPGSEFQQKIWSILQTIPFAETRSYKDQALALGNLNAIRAVAKANGENRISIVIPCHRVIGSNGDLIGYGGGIWRKKKLLELEARTAGAFEMFEVK